MYLTRTDLVREVMPFARSVGLAEFGLGEGFLVLDALFLGAGESVGYKALTSAEPFFSYPVALAVELAAQTVYLSRVALLWSEEGQANGYGRSTGMVLAALDGIRLERSIEPGMLRCRVRTRARVVRVLVLDARVEILLDERVVGRMERLRLMGHPSYSSPGERLVPEVRGAFVPDGAQEPDPRDRSLLDWIVPGRMGGKAVSSLDPLFSGHFRQCPVYPGSLMVETSLRIAVPGAPPSFGLDSVRFRRAALAPDLLTYEVQGKDVVVSGSGGVVCEVKGIG